MDSIACKEKYDPLRSQIRSASILEDFALTFEEKFTVSARTQPLGGAEFGLAAEEQVSTMPEVEVASVEK